MNGEITVTPENGQENMVSVVMTSTEDTLRMDISMRDENKQGFVTEIVVEYANAARFSMETDDGTVLKQVCLTLPPYTSAQSSCSGYTGRHIY